VRVGSARLAQEAEGASSRLIKITDRISVLVNSGFWTRWIADIFFSDLPHKMLASFLCD
jgi:hypothetical protein